MRRRLCGGLLALAMVATACSLQEPAATEPPATEGSVAQPPAPATTPPTTAAVIDAGLPTAPWSVPPLPAEAAPSILAEAWGAATNSSFCAALYPADANDLAADAVVRVANFGADAWAIAWDRPEGPGRDEEGEYCEDCGRGAFGLAGTIGLAPSEAVAIWPDQIEWSDGSRAGYGLEGLAEPGTGEPHLAYLAVEGQGCIYNVWSFLGEDHLLQLLDELRFVEGMLARVIGEQRVVTALGEPPWRRTPVGDVAVAQPLLDEWNEEVVRQATCPLLSPVSLGDDTDGATARRATGELELLAAWDLPDGPGRYGTGDYCADCGRGAIGIGTMRRDIDAPLGFERFGITHAWDDGSTLRIVSEATELFNLSPDVAGFTDPRSGIAVEAPHNGYLIIPGLGCAYRVWSFLGTDHLIGIAQNLRPVVGYGERVLSEGVCPVESSPSADFDGDGVAESFTLRPSGETASLIICGAEGPPIEVLVAGTTDVVALGDADGDGDVEIFIGDTGIGAVVFEVQTDEGEGAMPAVVLEGPEGDPFTLIEGVVGDDGYRWGCRDDGTVVQVEGNLRRGSLEWTRTAFRVEGLVAIDVGSGNGSTPVESSGLADALFEAAVTDLVGSSRCGG